MFLQEEVHRWLREAAQRANSSSCSSRNHRKVSTKRIMNSKESKDSEESRSSRISGEINSIKNREIEEKVKVAELIAKPELLQQKQIIQNEAEKL